MHEKGAAEATPSVTDPKARDQLFSRLLVSGRSRSGFGGGRSGVSGSGSRFAGSGGRVGRSSGGRRLGSADRSDRRARFGQHGGR